LFADALIRFAQKWITNGRHSYATLFILQTVFERYSPEQLDSLPDFRKSLEGLLMYTGTDVHDLYYGNTNCAWITKPFRSGVILYLCSFWQDKCHVIILQPAYSWQVLGLV